MSMTGTLCRFSYKTTHFFNAIICVYMAVADCICVRTELIYYILDERLEKAKVMTRLNHQRAIIMLLTSYPLRRTSRETSGESRKVYLILECLASHGEGYP
jgi:hypothetical protein